MDEFTVGGISHYFGNQFCLVLILTFHFVNISVSPFIPSTPSQNS